MVIEYQIKRIDVVKIYFYNLIHSRRTQLIIFGVASLLGLWILLQTYFRYGKISIYDLIMALMFALVLILLVPMLNFLTAKTQKRVLSINQQGIETRIGSKEGKIPWTAVDSIVDVNNRIVITGKNANVFTIPANAFSSNEQRLQFFNLAIRFHADSKLLI